MIKRYLNYLLIILLLLTVGCSEADDQEDSGDAGPYYSNVRYMPNYIRLSLEDISTIRTALGGKVVKIDVVIENMSNEKILFSTRDSVILGTNKNQYNSLYLTKEAFPGEDFEIVRIGDIYPSVKIRGSLLYEVNSEENDLKYLIIPTGLNQRHLNAKKFKLGQATLYNDSVVFIFDLEEVFDLENDVYKVSLVDEEYEGIEEEIDEEAIQSKVRVTGNRVAIRKSPGTNDKPSGDVLERVNAGDILDLINDNKNSIVLDNYIWWEVHNSISGVSGWSASEFLEVVSDDEIKRIQESKGVISEQRRDLVIRCAKSLINKKLKAPGTARWVYEELVEVDIYGRYLVYLEVDAQNSYGALIRNKVYVVLQSVDDDGTYRYNDFKPYVKEGESYLGFSAKESVKNFNGWNKPKE